MSLEGTPLTPQVTRSKPAKTPRSSKKSVFDQTYIEEEDQTYVYAEGVSDDDDDDDVYSDEDDLIAELEDDENTTDVESDLQDKEIINSASRNQVEPEPSNTLGITFDPSKAPSKFRKFLVKHEIIRKGFHSSIGVASLWFYTLGAAHTQFIMPLVVLFVIIFTNDCIRFSNPEINKIVVERFYYLIRESEIDHFNGTLYYLAGLILVFSTLPKDISLMSVLLLSWADTAASTFGRQFGKYTFQITKGKSFAGAMASFAAGIFSCYLQYRFFFVHWPQVNEPGSIMWTPATSKLSIHAYAVLCGAVASFSEFVDLYGIDDNFTIPVLGGFILYGVVKAFET
ncbi:Diacylglycerol kinase [Yamadazyma tenuis]|uniref:Phosphatidate cytidylyltransferase n=1 Tax=Candida tenuis (strain ATCC 10573 / BCRC 21748 / CBS 615 / JCM 9827 / NBRC 10315 / NRRL Y-1498 / VKM Y-70) TaxID=590646 RepID=G3BC79_CANTC|nr:uncharacterized protein CANTEDRAFT_116161 [Yamadazyma tenuis ATCC 10573]EGV61025.1 hypothetical protein CANTEDRAFT_116161 [Yamadazyma tenuis ATCC 10573]WEJ94625.1 Diacylglycerol kinase [Yamadazyma tenuis]